MQEINWLRLGVHPSLLDSKSHPSMCHRKHNIRSVLSIDIVTWNHHFSYSVTVDRLFSKDMTCGKTKVRTSTTFHKKYEGKKKKREKHISK